MNCTCVMNCENYRIVTAVLQGTQDLDNCIMLLRNCKFGVMSFSLRILALKYFSP